MHIAAQTAAASGFGFVSFAVTRRDPWWTGYSGRAHEWFSLLLGTVLAVQCGFLPLLARTQRTGSHELLLAAVVYTIGLLMPFAARHGFLQKSMSADDLQNGSLSSKLENVGKIVVLLGLSTQHFVHLGACEVLLRQCCVYVGVILLLVLYTRAVSERYYLHLHHYQVC